VIGDPLAPMDESAPATSRRLRPRFSLLTALLLMPIVGLAITVYLQHSELRSLRKETQFYRDEYGILTIGDRSKIHAIQLRTNEDLAWKWRIWIPEGQTVDLARISGDVPRTGFPPADRVSRFRSIQPGEHTLSIAIRKNEVSGDWEFVSEFQGVMSRTTLPADQQWFTQRAKLASSMGGVGRETKTAGFDEEGKFLLYRFRAVAGADSSAPLDTDDPLPGFMIWLERR
jgi:hypothetical protein